MDPSLPERQIMVQKRTYLVGLPPELHMEIFDQLDVWDVVSVALTGRVLFSSFEYWFKHEGAARLRRAQIEAKLAGKTIDTSKQTREWELQVFWCLFRHALLTDSPLIVKYIDDHMKEIDFEEYDARIQYSDWSPWLTYSSSLVSDLWTRKRSYLCYAICQDAPTVASWLLRKKSWKIFDKNLESRKVKEICWAIRKRMSSKQKELDEALRAACGMALPRVVNFLLEKGANPNAYDVKGMNALHCLVLPEGYHRIFLCEQDVHAGIPEFEQIDPLHDFGDITKALVAYGLDIHALNKPCRIHVSSDIAPLTSDYLREGGGNAVHLAAYMGFDKIIPSLVENGANVQALNRNGQTALYIALGEAWRRCAFDVIYDTSADENPIVYVPTRSTALHIACRFGNMWKVYKLLALEVDPNVVDSKGRTPLHEVLSNQSLRRESILGILLYLRRARAHTNPTTAMPTIGELIESHDQRMVRDMFEKPKCQHSVSGGPCEFIESCPGHTMPYKWKSDPLGERLREYLDKASIVRPYGTEDRLY
ncbi:ankyrin repeat-containing domain protein [Xylaria cf. heliscus]|nr:ankyrin repeat-containing domain protein [Xylaria cf. heliscus]